MLIQKFNIQIKVNKRRLSDRYYSTLTEGIRFQCSGFRSFYFTSVPSYETSWNDE